VTPGPLDVLVVGAGQAGLALGYELRGSGLRYELLEAASRVGEGWRRRWDSLHLFTAAEYSSLPGLPFPAPRGTHPHRDAVADYLESYAATLGLPVRTGTPVTRLTRDGAWFTALTPAGPVRARQVVVAVGPHSGPHVPGFARDLAGDVVQLHSAGYRRPDDVPAGPVLVVGAGNSGLQIAAELAAAGREVTVAVGSRPRPVPQRPLGRELFWWLSRSGVLSLPTTSRLARRLHAPELAVGTSWRRLREAGVRLRGRAVGASGRTVGLADGGAVDVEAVLWATGYRPDFSWIEVAGAVAGGRPVHRAGLSAVPGLAFLGLPWQRTRGSALLGFVGADAAWLARRLVAAA
jgi:putative flavoprotein involved in K+ transport